MTERRDLATVRVRDAVESDLPEIVEILKAGSLVEGKEDSNELAPYVAALAELQALPGGILVADSGGQVIGVCQLIVFRHLQSRGALCAEVESVHVHADWRRLGVGRLLMRAAQQRATELGCYRIQLTSNAARPDAHRFYEDLGYVPSHQGFKLPLE
jgi:GNAT superfamily N-acetyltransferase